MSDDFLRVPDHQRVRFGPQDIESNDASDEPWRATRMVVSRKLDPASAGKVLVGLRMSLRFREVLAAIAYCSDRSLSRVAELLIEQVGAELPTQLLELTEIVTPRGRPSATAEDEGFNRVIELQEAGQSYTTQFVGHWMDQALFLSPEHLDKLERLAQSKGVSADQMFDLVVASHVLRTAPR